MVNFVLDADGEESFGGLFKKIPAGVLRAKANYRRTLHFGDDAGNGKASFFRCRFAFGLDDFGVD